MRKPLDMTLSEQVDLAQTSSDAIISAAQRLNMSPLDLANALQGGEYVIVPKEPTELQIKDVVNLMMKASLGGDYQWRDYAIDVYRTFIAALSRLPQKAGG